MSSEPEQGGGVSELELKQALTAFKKRIKVMRLDQESRLGGGRPTTSGKKSDIAGIMPPGQFRREVWEELVRQGKLKSLAAASTRCHKP